jgi:hypothetical protein
MLELPWAVLGRQLGRRSQRPAHTDLIRVRAGGDPWRCGGVVKVVRTQRCQRGHADRELAAPTGPMWVAYLIDDCLPEADRPTSAEPCATVAQRGWARARAASGMAVAARLKDPPEQPCARIEDKGAPAASSRWRCPNGRRRRLLARTGGPMRSGYCCMPFTGTLKSADDDLMSSTVPPPLLADRSPDLRSSGRRPRREPATFQRGIGSCVRRVPIPACAHPVRPNFAMHLSVRSIGLTGTCCRMLSAWSRC